MNRSRGWREKLLARRLRARQATSVITGRFFVPRFSQVSPRRTGPARATSSGSRTCRSQPPSASSAGPPAAPAGRGVRVRRTRRPAHSVSSSEGARTVEVVEGATVPGALSWISAYSRPLALIRQVVDRQAPRRPGRNCRAPREALSIRSWTTNSHRIARGEAVPGRRDHRRRKIPGRPHRSLGGPGGDGPSEEMPFAGTEVEHPAKPAGGSRCSNQHPLRLGRVPAAAPGARAMPRRGRPSNHSAAGHRTSRAKW